MISVTKLLVAMPHASGPWIAGMVEIMPKWGIVGPVREASFLGQMRHECADFSRFQESLSYSDPERIAKIFRTAFDLDQDKVVDPEEIEFAKKYVMNPKALANRAYANRLGNGDEASGDGWKYRGRGPIQTTFKANYVTASKWTGINLAIDPDELLVPRAGCAAACGYWQDHGCNVLADIGDQREITRRINPGLAGLDERIRLVNETRKILEAP